MTIYILLPAQVKNVNDIINFFSNNGEFHIFEEQIKFYYNPNKYQKFCDINLPNKREEQRLISYFNNNERQYPNSNFIIRPKKKNLKIIINNLPNNLTVQELKEKLLIYGKVNNNNIKYDQGAYNATVFMEDEDEAQKVIENLNGQKWSENDNKTLIVKMGSENLSRYLVNSEDQEYFLEQKNYHLVTETLKDFVTLLCNKIDTQRK